MIFKSVTQYSIDQHLQAKTTAVMCEVNYEYFKIIIYYKN